VQRVEQSPATVAEHLARGRGASLGRRVAPGLVPHAVQLGPVARAEHGLEVDAIPLQAREGRERRGTVAPEPLEEGPFGGRQRAHVGIVQGRELAGFFRESQNEVRRVVWPTRQETVQTTLIVLATVVVVACVLWLFDAFLGRAVRWLTGIGG